MCGIVGIYSYRDDAPAVDPEELRRMRDYMRVRGPDGVGQWVSTDKRVALGHRRLSVIDPSDRASQPMQSADGRFVIIFNGEIYNYQALRAELENKGHVFRTTSDTEVLLQLYAAEGESMVHRLRGMFAFGLWDATKQTLLLARDPYGIKPLYYSNDGKMVRFASQVKALMYGGSINPALDPAGVVGFCLFGSVPEPFTIHSDVSALPAGSILLFNKEGKQGPKSYFSVANTLLRATLNAKPKSREESAEFARHALIDSVESHLVSDVPVGIFLSGGIDSGALTGLAAEVLGEERRALKTISIAFEEFYGRRDDEAPVAAQVAKLYGTDHSTRLVSRTEFDEDWPQILRTMDQPTIDGVNTWFVSKAARERGLKVALSGIGGDELFGGYPSFKDLPRWVSVLKLANKWPRLKPLFDGALGAISKFRRQSSPKAAGLIEYGGSYPGAYLLRRGLFMPWELPRLIGNDMAKEGLARLNPLDHIASALRPDPGDPFARVAALEASLYMRNQLLRDADWAGMAHSLEIRVPLVDRTLLERLAPRLIDADRAPGKSWLADSPRPSLPDQVLRRPKTGFLTPIAEWLPPNSASHQELTRPHWSRRLAVAVLSQVLPTDSNAAPAGHAA